MKPTETVSSCVTIGKQPLGIDLSRYRRHVDHLNLDDDRKHDLLLAVWQITGSFVDRAFGEDSTQLCRKNGDGFQELDETDSSTMIDCQGNTVEENSTDLSGTIGVQVSEKVERI